MIKDETNTIKIVVTGGSGFIGTNLVEVLINNGYDVINIDICEPQKSAHRDLWVKADISDYKELSEALFHIEPDYIIHLAARCDLEGTTLDDYSANVVGTKNLVDICKQLPMLKKVLFASSMLVCKPGYLPENEKDYSPHTVYGISKVEGEKIVWNSGLKIDWAIIRPTSIWGPGVSVPYKNFFEMILKHHYFHIGGNRAEMTYGYIENSVAQIMAILFTDTTESNKVYYIGDYEPVILKEWANEIAEVKGYKIITIPMWIMKCGALFGDLLKRVNVDFPLSSFRLKNMTTSNVLDLSMTKKIIKDLPVERVEGVKRTISWMEQEKN